MIADILPHFLAVYKMSRKMEEVYFSPFLVAIDEKTRSIVIAVRGTLSIEDMIVDMLAEGARVQEEDLGPTA
ncbi:unnamed protein product, partial [Dibothriocephalus latus]